MITNELVVIMATNKVNDWLDQAVNSCLDADGEPSLCLVLDGISTPINKQWVTNPRVKIIEISSSSGLANALTVGINSTSHEFISRLDSDDVANPRRFIEQYNYLRKHSKIGIVGSLARKIDKDGNLENLLPAPKKNERLANQLLKRNVFVHSSVTFRRKNYLQSGGYDNNLKTMEDYDLWLRMLTNCNGSIIPKELVLYRIHQNQMSRGAKPWGVHIKKIRSSRFALSQKLKISRLAVTFFQYQWEISQLLRFYGLKKPRNQF